MAGLRMEISGKDEALAALGEALARMDRPGPLFDEIGRMLTVSTQKRFEAGIDPEGNSWPKSLRARLTGGKTLVDTSNLMGSITHEASDEGVAVGTNVIYAGPHQTGATIVAKTAKGLRFEIEGAWVTRQSVTLPRRAFLGLDEDDESDIVALTGDFLVAPLGGADAESVDG